MKKGFLSGLFHRDKQLSFSRSRFLEQENARLHSRVTELEHQIVLLKEKQHHVENELEDAPYTVAGIRRLDVRGVSRFFGARFDCRQEDDGAIILGNVKLYQDEDGVPVELRYPPRLHFEALSQVTDIICSLAYPELDKLLEPCGESAYSDGFLPCTWEDILDESGAISVHRYTLASPNQNSFIRIRETQTGRQVTRLQLNADIYLERVMKHLERTLSECEQEEARAYCDAVLENVCDIWRENFPGVVFPNQFEEEVDTIIERTD